jgi:hypothetical protein
MAEQWLLLVTWRLYISLQPDFFTEAHKKPLKKWLLIFFPGHPGGSHGWPEVAGWRSFWSFSTGTGFGFSLDRIFPFWFFFGSGLS